MCPSFWLRLCALCWSSVVRDNVSRRSLVSKGSHRFYFVPFRRRIYNSRFGETCVESFWSERVSRGILSIRCFWHCQMSLPITLKHQANSDCIVGAFAQIRNPRHFRAKGSFIFVTFLGICCGSSVPLSIYWSAQLLVDIVGRNL